MQNIQISKPSAIAVGIIVLLQFSLLAFSLLAAPGYTRDLFTTPGGIFCTLSFYGWEAIGIFVVILKTNDRTVTIFKWVLFVLFCAIPALLYPMVGPAIITIVKALGPVMQDSSTVK